MPCLGHVFSCLRYVLSFLPLKKKFGGGYNEFSCRKYCGSIQTVGVAFRKGHPLCMLQGSFKSISYLYFYFFLINLLLRSSYSSKLSV